MADVVVATSASFVHMELLRALGFKHYQPRRRRDRIFAPPD